MWDRVDGAERGVTGDIVHTPNGPVLRALNVCSMAACNLDQISEQIRSDLTGIQCGSSFDLDVAGSESTAWPT